MTMQHPRLENTLERFQAKSDIVVEIIGGTQFYWKVDFANESVRSIVW